MNSVNLIGRLTRDIDIKYTPSGKAVGEMGMAIQNRVKKGGEWVDDPVFVDITVWDKSAENCGKFLKKGSMFGIVGRLSLDTWEKDGKRRSKLKVTADKVDFMLAPRGHSRPEEEDQRPAIEPEDVSQDPKDYGMDEENLPF